METLSTSDLKHHTPTIYGSVVTGCECGWGVSAASAVSPWGQYVLHLPKLDATGVLILTPEDIGWIMEIWNYNDKGLVH